jgi:hypothetical protein
MAGVVAVVMANESWRLGQMMGWDETTEKMVPAYALGEKNDTPDSAPIEPPAENARVNGTRVASR